MIFIVLCYQKQSWKSIIFFEVEKIGHKYRFFTSYIKILNLFKYISGEFLNIFLCIYIKNHRMYIKCFQITDISPPFWTNVALFVTGLWKISYLPVWEKIQSAAICINVEFGEKNYILKNRWYLKDKSTIQHNYWKLSYFWYTTIYIWNHILDYY